MARDGRSRWYRAGCAEGEFAAQVNLREPDAVEELKGAMEKDAVGEICGQIREHQVQMAGDISYDVGKPGGPSDEQYERWEDGFCTCFSDRVRAELAPKPARRAVGADCIAREAKDYVLDVLRGLREARTAAQQPPLDVLDRAAAEVEKVPEC